MSLNARKAEGLAYFLAFMACIPTANWMIGHIGTTCVPSGPCLLPVFPWSAHGGPIMAPSGVSMIGIALVLRDLVQRRLGRMPALMAIVAGAALSGALAPPQLVLASTAAFFLQSRIPRGPGAGQGLDGAAGAAFRALDSQARRCGRGGQLRLECGRIFERLPVGEIER